MFKWLNKQGVESLNEGYSLQRVDRFYYDYTEGARVLKVAVEPGLKNEEIILPEKLTWQPPSEREPINAQKAATIRRHITEALTFMGTNRKFS
jgi:hypothetical protein